MNTAQKSNELPGPGGLRVSFRAAKTANRYNLLTAESKVEIQAGRLPDLEPLCLELYRTFTYTRTAFNALQFVPLLQQLAHLDTEDKNLVMEHEASRHVLVQNNLMKIVLIRWAQGDQSDIHGHPAGGCVFKVLDGDVEEKRFTTNDDPRLLSTSSFKEGALAYIDDNIAFHSVGNVSNKAAISLHVYTPGIRKVS